MGELTLALVVRPLDNVTWTGPSGVRYQNPEIVLLFMARHGRRHGQQLDRSRNFRPG